MGFCSSFCANKAFCFSHLSATGFCLKTVTEWTEQVWAQHPITRWQWFIPRSAPSSSAGLCPGHGGKEGLHSWGTGRCLPGGRTGWSSCLCGTGGDDLPAVCATGGTATFSWVTRQQFLHHLPSWLLPFLPVFNLGGSCPSQRDPRGPSPSHLKPGGVQSCPGVQSYPAAGDQSSLWSSLAGDLAGVPAVDSAGLPASEQLTSQPAPDPVQPAVQPVPCPAQPAFQPASSPAGVQSGSAAAGQSGSAAGYPGSIPVGSPSEISPAGTPLMSLHVLSAPGFCLKTVTTVLINIYIVCKQVNKQAN